MDPGSLTGLSGAEVRARTARGLVNSAPADPGRSFTRILAANVFTVFNAVVGGSFALLLVLGAWQDALFGFFVVANTLIGVVQEFRAKQVLSRLAVLTAPRVLVRRDGAEVHCALEDVVQDDLLILRPGEQIAADAVVVAADELEVDESLLTGEAEPVSAAVGRQLLSGTAVVAGSGVARATGVGPASYATRLTNEARRFSLIHSELRGALSRIIRWLSLALLPVTAIVVNGQMLAAGGWAQAIEDGGWRDAAIRAIASVIAMVPAGLVFITSVALAVGAVRLARSGVLVRELGAVEGLARVDALCIDKTGTLTEGAMTLDRIERLGPEHGGWRDALAAFAADPSANATARAIGQGLDRAAPAAAPTAVVPFSSRYKWSAIQFGDVPHADTWILGGADVVLVDQPESAEVRRRAAAISASGARTLVLAHSMLPLTTGRSPGLPRTLQPVALLVLRERVRSDAAEILGFFAAQGVAVYILSGDEPRTVTGIARACGLTVDQASVDARDLPEARDALAEVLASNRVFGRVTPEQKRSMVAALQSSGHTVAMIGDGLNDTLALKHADLGIAMGTGAPAARGVAHLVLLDDGFADLPGVVAEGRRVIANVERLSGAFLTKTVYAIVFAVLFGVAMLPFPFLPRQLSIVDGLTIGLPALVLAFLPNARKYRPGFLRRTARFCIPSGLIVAAAVLAATAATHLAGASAGQVQTAAFITLTATGIWVLAILARPLVPITAAVVAGGYLGLALVIAAPPIREFLLLEPPTAPVALTAVLIAGGAAILLEVVHRLLPPDRAAAG